MKSNYELLNNEIEKINPTKKEQKDESNGLTHDLDYKTVITP